MRIITGKFKRNQLFTVPGKTTRPTTDFIKEVIFSVLDNCTGKKVLDLFSGSGNLALEALSQGASHVEMVDMADKAIKTIKRNVEKLGCSDQCRIARKRVSSYLAGCTDHFDLIFLDPPYQKNLVNRTVELIVENEIITIDGTVVVEHSPKEKLDAKWQKFVTFTKSTSTTQISILHMEEF